MATLTYDSSEVQDGEFTPEELDSLQVGEQLYQEEQNLLAGKFRDADELENAYLELQRKLGDRNTEVEPPQDEVEEPQDEVVDSSFLDELWNESLSEYKEETLSKLEQLSAAEVAQMYLDYRAQAEQQAPEVSTLSQEDVSQLQSVVGGPENYNSMIGWAANNLSEQEISMFDTVMDRGDPLACYFAIQALASRYNDAAGYDGRMLQGSAARNETVGFRSQAELVRAMSDPRYDNDPAYRADVAAKLEISDLQF